MLLAYQHIINSPAFHVFALIYDVVSFTAFIWGPILLIWLAQHLWLEYRQLQYIHHHFDFVMLQIKMPRVIEKTPLAMELVLLPLHHVKTGNWWERWWDGYVKPWFSLEMVSIEGEVKFFIRTPSKFKKLIEATIYAQYPDIEVEEVPDYISLAPYNQQKDEWNMWGCHFALTKPDPYPIKTYVDFGLDSTMTKEEFKSDPLTSLIEFLGSLGRGQQMWFQILVKSTDERFHTPGKWFKRHDWKDEAKVIIKKMQDKQGEFGFFKASKREGEIVHAIERSLSKPGFDCGFRAVYIAKKEFFDSSAIGGMLGAYRPFSTQDLNGFKPQNIGVDYPWEDFRDMRLNYQKRKLYDAYVRRSWFYAPYKKRPFVLNSEELATIFHFPGGVAETPTLSRIESRKGEPPPNLPI